MGDISVNPAFKPGRLQNGPNPFQPIEKYAGSNVIPLRPARIAGGNIRDNKVRDIVDLSPLAQQFLEQL